MPPTHRYDVTCSWSGSTGRGYEAYDRAHDVAAGPSTPALTISADPAFHGDPALLNPEELLLMAAASCQLLTFLAVAARSRIDVVAYRDTAKGFMPEDDKPVRITRIELAPHITVASDVPEEKVHRLVEIAHRQCFIANSLTSEIIVTPTIVLPQDDGGPPASV